MCKSKKRNDYGRVIEVIGLPGSGKSTLVKKTIAGDKYISSQDRFIRDAASCWLRSYAIWGHLLVGTFLKRIAEQKYFSSDILTLRFLRANPELADILAEWVAKLHFDNGVQYLSRVFLLNQTIKRARLIDGFSTDRIVLLDEHWLQLLTVILSAQDDQQYLAWFKRIVPLIPMPDGVIWLSDASAVIEKRQVTRGKIATIFVGSPNIEETGSNIERRMTQALEWLEVTGISILRLDATIPITENVAQLRQWVREL